MSGLLQSGGSFRRLTFSSLSLRILGKQGRALALSGAFGLRVFDRVVRGFGLGV